MDFLTQPLIQSQPKTTKPSPKISDDSSVLTASTSDTTDARITSNAGFEQLRTATNEPSTLPDETLIAVPSTKEGDWKAYGRVEGRVLLWEEGTLKEKRAINDATRREQWIVNGTLWFTKRSEILLVLDQSVPPRQIVREPEGRPTGRLSLSRLRSSSPSNAKTTEQRRHSVSEEDASKPTHEESSPGFFTKVLDAVRPGRKERRTSSSSSGGGLSLSRSRSRSRAETTEPVQDSHSYGGGPGSTHATQKTVDSLTHETGQLTFEEPASTATPSPFPLYKGHDVTGLFIASPAHIQSLRFYPQRPISASSQGFFSFSNSSQPLSSPPSSPGTESIPVEHPVVELDVLDPARMGSIDEGKKREVTIGFSFVEVLCATEADDFHNMLELAMSGDTEPETIHRTVSRSLETGNSQQQRRKSFSFKV